MTLQTGTLILLKCAYACARFATIHLLGATGSAGDGPVLTHWCLSPHDIGTYQPARAVYLLDTIAVYLLAVFRKTRTFIPYVHMIYMHASLHICAHALIAVEGSQTFGV